MNHLMKWMPLLPYVLTTAGLLSTLALFLALKREIRRHAQRQKTGMEEIATRLHEDHPSEAPPLEPVVEFVPTPLRAGLNLNKRVHAMRMLRRGEDTSHIAAALGVPRREVELLIRVLSIGKTRAAQAGSE
jgi:hypothetical protein